MLLSKENVTLANIILLQQCFGAGSIKAVKIFNILRDNEVLDNVIDKTTISSTIEEKDVNKLLSFDRNKVYNIIDDCLKNNIKIITICDIEYPNSLRNVIDSPLVLYVKGECIDFDKLPLISIVGPRKISEFGKKAAFSLSKRQRNISLQISPSKSMFH